MRMKKLTLDINERQEQEDYQGTKRSPRSVSAAALQRGNQKPIKSVFMSEQKLSALILFFMSFTLTHNSKAIS